tara:strand:- start:136 stop:1656 length:1521 start_codon:yes stop_codon:yes gene_type:complete
MINNRAAVYLRSSKDRSDVSIAAQRRDLNDLATERGLIIVEEFIDAVESGKTENRPGFQSLYVSMKSRQRGWSTLLLLDTSRLSRRQYISHFFEHEAEKQGIRIVYKSLPDADPISSMMLKTILQAMDQWHSMISKQKGLAGMAENVKQGFRAGGAAPKGYQLEKIATGAIRDGQAVMKSRLIPGKEADKVSSYLKQRAMGIGRQSVLTRMNLNWSATTALSMEWNALTYAGHTIWNVHEERVEGRSKTGKKRRPRDQWHINKDTHEGLITEDEAEAILKQLEDNKHKSVRSTSSKYLLSGLLRDENDNKWSGDASKYYRAAGGRGRRMTAMFLDELFLSQLKADLQSAKFTGSILRRAKKAGQTDTTKQRAALHRQIDQVDTRIQRLVELASTSSAPDAFLRSVESKENERRQLLSAINELDEQSSAENYLASLTEFDIKRALDQLFKDLHALDRESLKDFICRIVERVVVAADKKNPRMVIHYRIHIRGFNMASPRGFEPLLPP